MELKEQLEQLGLEHKEINVYLACLSLGETTIVPIAKKTGLPRTTVFHILERLGDQKLIEIIQKGSRHLYAPYPPRSIATALKQKRAKLDEQIDTMEHALPELMRIYNISPFQPKVRFFQNHDIRLIYEEILDAGVNESWYVGESNKIVEVLGERYLRNWIKRRIEARISSKSIRVRKEEHEDPAFHGRKEYLRIIRYAPDGFQSPAHILIYGDNVALMTTAKESFGIVITSRDYAETMRNWFRELWKVSKE